MDMVYKYDLMSDFFQNKLLLDDYVENSTSDMMQLNSMAQINKQDYTHFASNICVQSCYERGIQK